jgi:hypothetical protein
MNDERTMRRRRFVSRPVGSSGGKSFVVGALIGGNGGGGGLGAATGATGIGGGAGFGGSGGGAGGGGGGFAAGWSIVAGRPSPYTRNTVAHWRHRTGKPRGLP